MTVDGTSVIEWWSKHKMATSPGYRSQDGQNDAIIKLGQELYARDVVIDICVHVFKFIILEKAYLEPTFGSGMPVRQGLDWLNTFV